MAVGTIDALTNSVANTNSVNAVSKKAAETKSDAKSTAGSEKDVFGEAAVYEKSKAADTAGEGQVTKADKNDRSAIIAQLKADAEARQNQLMEIVRKTMQGQGKTLATADDMWKFLASGDFTVDAATKKQAQEDISENGYWGVNQTSDRIVDFAKALSGGDSSKADELLEAFKKGFKEATKTWGKDLPDISKQTYDAVVKKFDAWKNESKKPGNETQEEKDTKVKAAAESSGVLS